MATKSVHVRIDAKEKQELETLLGRMGLDLPTAVRIFFRKINMVGGIPFSLDVREEIDHYTPKQLARFDRIAKEAMKGKNIAASFKMPEDREKMSQWLRHG